MGLIQAIKGSVGGTLSDQWKTFIKCDDMGQEILMQRVSTPNGVIAKDSAIMVAPGQLAVIFQSGQILDATAEEGLYTFDESTMPTFFAGQFGAVFKEMWQRFTFGGAPAKEQAVFYINIREILNNKFGTRAPVPFQSWQHAIPNQMTGNVDPMRVAIRCFGKYTFQVCDPAIFMRTFAGTGEMVRKDALIEQMESEVIAALQSVLNELGNQTHQVRVLELPSNTPKIKEIMDERVFDEPIRNRGVKLVGFAIESVTLDEDSEKRITQYENNANAMMQQGRVLDVMETAAGNEGGSMGAFMGLGMMNMASGGMSGGVMQNTFQQQPGTFPASQQVPQPAPEQPQAAPVAEEGITCPNCGIVSNGKFCAECGTSKEPQTVNCANCNVELANGAKFCAECGTATTNE